MDTSTIRLVIFVGMFLVFAGDYSALISSIFGNATERNVTDTVREPEDQFKNPHDKLDIVLKKDNKNDGKNIMCKRYEILSLHKYIIARKKISYKGG